MLKYPLFFYLTWEPRKLRNPDLKEGYEKEINASRQELDEVRTQVETWYARKLDEDAIAAVAITVLGNEEVHSE